MNSRKTKFVDPKVQGELARRLVLHWGIFTLVAAAVAIGMQWLSNPFVSVGQTVAEAWWTHGPILLVLIGLLPVFVFDSIRLSAKFAGPVKRFRAALAKLAGGERPSQMTFRSDDYWQELASDLNKVTDRVFANEAAQIKTQEEV